MVEVAHCAVRMRNSRFRVFFMRVSAKKGNKTAYVAVTRKILTVIWRLLVSGERNVKEGLRKLL